MASLDFESLTNDQIREELLSRGQEVGPVIDTTRSIYLRKLKRLVEPNPEPGNAVNGTTEEAVEKAGGDAQSKTANMMRELGSIKDADLVFENVTEPPHADIRQNGLKGSSPPPPSPKGDVEDECDENLADESYYGEESSRYITSAESKYASSNYSENQMHFQNNHKGVPIRGRSYWVLRFLALVFAVCGIVYFLNVKSPKKLEPDEDL